MVQGKSKLVGVYRRGTPHPSVHCTHPHTNNKTGDSVHNRTQCVKQLCTVL